MPETLSPVLHHVRACSCCGAGEARARLGTRGAMQFCTECAREMAVEAAAAGGTVRLIRRLLVVALLLGATAWGAWWVRTNGLHTLAAIRQAIAPLVKASAVHVDV